MFFVPAFATGGKSVKGDDYSEAFALLRDLGVPSVEGAEWGSCSSSARNNMQFNMYSNGVCSLLEKLKVTESHDQLGFWLVRSDSGSHLIAPGDLTQTPLDSDAEWDSVPVKLIVEQFLEKMEVYEGGSPIDELRYNGQARGHLLIFAAQLDQAGHTVLANRFASACFNANGETTLTDLVDDAIDVIAEYKFGLVNTSFSQDGDWAEYGAGLNSLTNDFPRGWKNSGAVKILAYQVGKRVKHSGNPSLDFPASVKISPQAQSLLEGLLLPDKQEGEEVDILAQLQASGVPISEEELAKVPPEMLKHILESYTNSGALGGNVNVAQYWILGRGEAKETSDGIKQLTMLGWDGFYALTQALTVDQLTYQMRRNTGRSYYGRGSQDVERYEKGLSRPLSLGEISKQALLKTIPDPNNNLDEMSMENLQQYALEWMKRYHKLTKGMVALAIISDSADDVYNAVAATEFLLEEGNQEDLRALRELILKSKQPITYQQVIERYMEVEADGASEFLPAYISALRTTLAGVSKDNTSEYGAYSIFNQHESVEAFLRALEAKYSGGGLDTLLAELEGGEVSSRQAFVKLNSYVNAESAGGYAELGIQALKRAEKCSEMSARERLLFFTSYLARYFGRGMGAESAMELLGEHRELISALRSRDAVIDNLGTTVSTQKNLIDLICNSYFSPLFLSESVVYKEVLREEYAPLLNARVQAFLDDQPLPSFPSSDSVNMEDLVAKVPAIVEQDGLALLSAVEQLPPNEQHALLTNLYSEPHFAPLIKNTKWLYNPGYTERALDSHSLLSRFPLTKGDRLDAPSLKIAITAMTQTSVKEPTMITLYRERLLGLQLRCEAQSADFKLSDIIDYLGEIELNETGDQVLIVELSTSGNDSYACFPGDIEQQEVFWLALQEEFSDTESSNSYMDLSMLIIPPEKISELRQNQD